MAEFLRGENNLTIIKDKDKPFRILQLTDIHIGGGFLSRKKDKTALSAVEKVVKASNADFIIVTGDLVYPIPFASGTINNIRPTKQVAGLLDKLGVPFTICFGNHDAEAFAFANKEKLAKIYTSYKNCYFYRGEKNITGLGNQVIELKNADGKLNMLLMCIDSNSYLTKSFFSGFDIIHDDQIEWYKRTVQKYSDGASVIPSLAFYHIPPKEFKEAWDKYYLGNCTDVYYHHGFVGEKDNYFGYPKETKCNFFSEMVALQSCKGMFMGHDHLNTLSLTYQGIRLTYGMSIDCLAYPKIIKKHTQRGGTLIDIFDDGHFDVKMLPLDLIRN